MENLNADIVGSLENFNAGIVESAEILNNAVGIVEALEQKSFLVTGATGFLAKIFVEKLLRVQPNLKQLFLLVRAPDASSAAQRFHDEVVGKELFGVLRRKFGDAFDSFISDKVTPVAGDISLQNLGIKDSNLTEKMWNDIDFVVNFAATTNFRERYDVALGINTIGAKNVLDFSKKCLKLKMLVHISTAYVWGEKRGLLLEKPLKMGETMNGITSVALESETELKLVAQRLEELVANQVSKKEETDAMKEFGLQRARLFGWQNTYVFTKAMGEMVIGELRGDVPVVIVRPAMVTSTYKEPFPGWVESASTGLDLCILDMGNGNVKCGVANPGCVVDILPADMVVNATIVAMVVTANQPLELEAYQVGSSASAPINSAELRDIIYKFFTKNPLFGKNGKPIKVPYPIIFPNMASFRMCFYIKYMLPLKGLQLLNAILCNYFRDKCNAAMRKTKYLKRKLKLYEPYILFKGIFDDKNTERLREVVSANIEEEAVTFYFDPKSIHWEDYFMNIHIPGLVKSLIIANENK